MSIVNITVQNDADFYRAFSWQTVEGAPIDMSGGTMEMMLRRRASDQTALLRLATDTGEIVMTNPANGAFTVRLSQVMLERLGIGSFEHSNIFTRGGYKVRIWTGTFTNSAGATR